MRAVGLPLALACAALLLAACAPHDAARPAAAGGSELRVRWALPEGFPARVRLYRALPDQPTWQTRTAAPGEAVASGVEIVDGVLPVTLDVPERVLVVIENPLDRAVRFWVAPHLPTPHRADTALMTRCLCVGDTYEVPARGTWTRVIELGIRRRDAVPVLVVTHVVTLGEAPAIEAPPPGAAR